MDIYCDTLKFHLFGVFGGGHVRVPTLVKWRPGVPRSPNSLRHWSAWMLLLTIKSRMFNLRLIKERSQVK